MQIIETKAFTRLLPTLLSDEDYAGLQNALRARPDVGALIPGGSGLRKVRWGAGAKGKRGGARVIYYWATTQGVILLLFGYAKAEREDLTKDQLAALRKLVEREYR